MGSLKLANLNKAFGAVHVLHDIDLDINDGEFVVFVGPSGCGKSTLLRIIAGLEDISSGNISISDRDVSALSPAERKIAMVFQSYALYPHMSVRKTLPSASKIFVSNAPKSKAGSTKQPACWQSSPISTASRVSSPGPAPARCDRSCHCARTGYLPVR